MNLPQIQSDRRGGFSSVEYLNLRETLCGSGVQIAVLHGSWNLSMNLSSERRALLGLGISRRLVPSDARRSGSLP